MRDEAAYWKGMTWVVVSYVVALIVGLLVGQTVPTSDPLWVALWADVAATIAIFGFSLAFRNTSFYDAYWSVAPLAIVAYWAIFSGADGSAGRQTLVAGCLVFWGVRLTSNWATGWEGLHHEDWRYVDLQHQTGIFYWPVSLLGLHMMPTLLVFLGLWPAYEAVISPAPINALDYVAAAVGIGATVIEGTADAQMRAFRARSGQKGVVMQEGLWNHSRHPNYFGEISLWLSMWLFALAAGASAVTGVGVLAMILLFRFISIPMMEKRQLERRPAYARYQARVSMIVPWFTTPPTAEDLAAPVQEAPYDEPAKTDAIADKNVRMTIDTMPFIPPPGEE